MAKCTRYKVRKKAYKKSRHKKAMQRNIEWFVSGVINGYIVMENMNGDMWINPPKGVSSR